MPLYEYQCDVCGHRFETIVKFSDPPIDTCPKCGGPVRKLMSSPAIQFKGSGWYITDYARAGKDATDSKDAKEGTESKAAKEAQATKDAKAPTDAKETKDTKKSKTGKPETTESGSSVVKSPGESKPRSTTKDS